MGWGMKDSLLKNFTEQFLNNQDMGGNVPTVVAMKRDGGKGNCRSSSLSQDFIWKRTDVKQGLLSL